MQRGKELRNRAVDLVRPFLPHPFRIVRRAAKKEFLAGRCYGSGETGSSTTAVDNLVRNRCSRRMCPSVRVRGA